MTTASSPLPALKRQADQIAQTMKRAELGQLPDPTGKIAAARARPTFRTAVVMDDKTLVIEMPWSKIRETSESGISEWILNQMREAAGQLQ